MSYKKNQDLEVSVCLKNYYEMSTCAIVYNVNRHCESLIHLLLGLLLITSFNVWSSDD